LRVSLFSHFIDIFFDSEELDSTASNVEAVHSLVSVRGPRGQLELATQPQSCQ
jgi:hypothetical protein